LRSALSISRRDVLPPAESDQEAAIGRINTVRELLGEPSRMTRHAQIDMKV
jgi:hypothetical protein